MVYQLCNNAVNPDFYQAGQICTFWYISVFAYSCCAYMEVGGTVQKYNLVLWHLGFVHFILFSDRAPCRGLRFSRVWRNNAYLPRQRSSSVHSFACNNTCQLKPNYNAVAQSFSKGFFPHISHLEHTLKFSLPITVPILMIRICEYQAMLTAMFSS